MSIDKVRDTLREYDDVSKECDNLKEIISNLKEKNCNIILEYKLPRYASCIIHVDDEDFQNTIDLSVLELLKSRLKDLEKRRKRLEKCLCG